jgi:hypothetical protein
MSLAIPRTVWARSAGASLLVLAGLASLAGCGSSLSPRQVSDSVDTAHFSGQLLDLDGNRFDLWQRDPSRVTVAVFTRSDCPISNRFAPEISRLFEKYHGQGVDFFLIYVDPRESPAAIRHHLAAYDYPCQALRDPQHTLVRYCHASVTPETVVFDRDRTITYVGRINDLYPALGQSRTEPSTHDLADAIESTILDRPVAVARTKAIGCLIADLKD